MEMRNRNVMGTYMILYGSQFWSSLLFLWRQKFSENMQNFFWNIWILLKFQSIWKIVKIWWKHAEFHFKYPNFIVVGIVLKFQSIWFLSPATHCQFVINRFSFREYSIQWFQRYKLYAENHKQRGKKKKRGEGG